MHTGPHGALQLNRRRIKMILKEDTVPATANRLFFAGSWIVL